MFIKYKDINNRILIDVRTNKEFLDYSICKENIPVINEKTYLKIKKFYPCALFVILYELYKDREYITRRLYKVSKNGTRPITLMCSRGRLRSPVMCLYAKYLGIDANVLWKGIKGNK